MEENKRRRFEAVGASLSSSCLVGMVLISSCVLVVGLEEKNLDRQTWKKTILSVQPGTVNLRKA